MKYFGIILSIRIHCFQQNDLIRAKEAKNEQIVNNINGGLTDLRNAIIKKEIPENENSHNKQILSKKPSTFINNFKCFKNYQWHFHT